uniref:Uncharacterized protein n=1 Tax=Catharus ustulatus TaxID=91951 RepID=A0A8C3Y8G7_CATUS
YLTLAKGSPGKKRGNPVPSSQQLALEPASFLVAFRLTEANVAPEAGECSLGMQCFCFRKGGGKVQPSWAGAPSLEGSTFPIPGTAALALRENSHHGQQDSGLQEGARRQLLPDGAACSSQP